MKGELLTPKRLAGALAVGGLALNLTGYYWIGCGMLLGALLLWWLTDLTL